MICCLVTGNLSNTSLLKPFSLACVEGYATYTPEPAPTGPATIGYEGQYTRP